MGKHGQYYHEFYVGIASDPNDRLVEMLVGTMPQVVKLVYILVGLSCLYMIKLAKKAV